MFTDEDCGLAEWMFPRKGVADIVGCPVLDMELNTQGKLGSVMLHHRQMMSCMLRTNSENNGENVRR